MGTNKIAISCFTRGLHEEIESRMRNREIGSLQDAINSVVMVDNEIKSLT